VSNPVIHTLRDVDGMAVIGRTRHDLMGIRYEDGEGGNTPAPPAPDAAATPAAPATPAEPVTPPAAPAENVADLPAWAQKIITETRAEAADNRVKAKAETDRVNAILKAAGIQTEEPDPAALLTQSQADAAASKRELAVYKAASAAGADPSKLLDRASFLTSIQAIDPTDGAAIKAAIQAAVAADATLKAARAAGASAIDGPGGTGEAGQLTAEQIKNMTPEQIVEADKKGLLRNYLAS